MAEVQVDDGHVVEVAEEAVDDEWIWTCTDVSDETHGIAVDEENMMIAARRHSKQTTETVLPAHCPGDSDERMYEEES